MDKENRISRRSALKRIGAAVLGGAAAASGMLPAVSCSQQGKKRIIFYFTGTGNKHIPENLERLKEDIAARRHWHEPVTEEERQMHRDFMARTGLDPETGYLLRSDKYFTVTGACISCGICTYVCPNGNYVLDSGTAEMSGDCEFCFACIQNCPQRAIRFRRQEEGSFFDGTEKNPDARYRNEHISLMDLKMANNQKL